MVTYAFGADLGIDGGDASSGGCVDDADGPDKAGS
jgi:hypothetical protein